MSNVGKKRSKSYYKKCANKKVKRGGVVLETGLKGFLVTSNNNEKLAIKETYNLLNEYADKLFGPEQLKRENASSDDDSDDDVEKSLQKEIQALKQVNQSERRFKYVNSGAKSVIFIKTTLDDPCHLAHAILSDLAETKINKARFAIRLLPVSVISKCYVDDIKKAVEVTFDKPFRGPFGTGVSYSTVYKARNNNSCSRDLIISAIGDVIKNLNPLNHVNHDDPDFTVIVEIICSLCCLSVVKDFRKLRKYNLHEVVKEEDKNDDGRNTSYSAACPADPLEHKSANENASEEPPETRVELTDEPENKSANENTCVEANSSLEACVEAPVQPGSKTDEMISVDPKTSDVCSDKVVDI